MPFILCCVLFAMIHENSTLMSYTFRLLLCDFKRLILSFFTIHIITSYMNLFIVLFLLMQIHNMVCICSLIFMWHQVIKALLWLQHIRIIYWRVTIKYQKYQKTLHICSWITIFRTYIYVHCASTHAHMHTHQTHIHTHTQPERHRGAHKCNYTRS